MTKDTRTCSTCGRKVPYADVARGHIVGGRTAVLTDADLAALPLPSIRSIDVLAFVDTDTIDPIRLGPTYYLAAEPTVTKPYVLLRDCHPAAWQRRPVTALLRSRVRMIRIWDLLG